MADITLAQMLKYETVVGVFSRLRSPATQMSTYYGLRVESPGTQRAISGRVLGWDTFDNTRTMAKARAPYSGPARTAPKKVGHVTGTCVRLYESIPIYHEQVYGTRPLGGSYDSAAVDRTGQRYVGRQIKFGAQRMGNSMEFMASRMFRGGFSVLVEDEDHFLRETGSGTVDVSYQIPAANTGQVPLAAAADYGGSDGDDVINASWDDPTTDVLTNLLVLSKVAERQTGYTLTDFWIDSTTLGWLLENNQLTAVAGSAYRVFDMMTGQDITTVDAGQRPQGYTVQFRACPQFLFHVYDAVLNVDSQVDSSAVGDVSQYCPTGTCLATPPPGGDWYGLGVGGEPIRENDESETQYKEGFDTWSKRMNDPPGEELRALNNVLPLLYVPKAVYYMTVQF